MKRLHITGLAACAALLSVVTGSLAQQPPPQFPNMTFFITSTGGPSGANYGGLEGANKHCQTLAEKAGAGAKTWRAYLSTQAVGGATAVNAKDRIGKGPWVNAKGVQIAASVDDLHGPNNKIAAETLVSENGRLIPSRLYTVNQHDILTGSRPTAPPSARQGHDLRQLDEVGRGQRHAWATPTAWACATTTPSKSWNASHPSRACDAASLVATGGAGLLSASPPTDLRSAS